MYDNDNPHRSEHSEHRGRGDRGGDRGGRGGDRGGDRSGRGQRRDPDREGRGIPLSELDPALTEVSRKLIGAAIEVHKTLGPGYDKSVYVQALEMELQAGNVPFVAHKEYPIYYRGKEVGRRRADLLIDNRFVADLYAHRGEIGSGERSALRALLKAADMELGLIINFAERRLKDGLVRVLNAEKLNIKEPGSDDHGDSSHEPQG